MSPAPPTPQERYLVYRCLLTNGILIGNEAEVWTHSSAYRALKTMRLVVAAIHKLIGAWQAVWPSHVKSLVLRDLRGETEIPFALDEVGEFMVNDPEGREYWSSLVIDSSHPVLCPLCKVAAAYVGFNEVVCKAKCRV